MAEVVNVAGACRIIVGSGGTLESPSLENLGYSINGVQIFEDVYMSDVPGDQKGGDEGPPIELQAFGDVHRIRIEFSKFDSAVMEKVEKRLRSYSGQDPGESIPLPGTLIFVNGYYFRVLLQAPNFVRNYLIGIPRTPIQGNFGTKFTRKVLEFECHDNGATPPVMWNDVIV